VVAAVVTARAVDLVERRRQPLLQGRGGDAGESVACRWDEVRRVGWDQAVPDLAGACEPTGVSGPNRPPLRNGSTNPSGAAVKRRTVTTALSAFGLLVVPVAPAQAHPGDGSVHRHGGYVHYVDVFVSEGICGIDMGGWYLQAEHLVVERVDPRLGPLGYVRTARVGYTNLENGKHVSLSGSRRDRLTEKQLCRILVRRLDL